jgi:hypothetical protein
MVQAEAVYLHLGLRRPSFRYPSTVSYQVAVLSLMWVTRCLSQDGLMGGGGAG